MKPKIIHIIPGKANPDRLNGVNKVVYSVAKTMQDNHESVAVWGIAANTETDTDYPFPVQLFKGSVRSPFFPHHLKTHIKLQPPGTIFHLHGVLHPFYARLSFYLKRKGFAFVVTPHGALLRRSVRRGFWYKYPYLLLIERAVLRRAKKIHAITQMEKKDLTAWCRASKIRIIPNGTSLPVTSQPPHPLHEEPVFLYMGRFDKQHKGLDLALEAFAIFHQKMMRGQFILAGSGQDEKWLRERIRQLHLTHKITLLPPQFGADKQNLLERADIFVHPSRWDVLPTVILEAAASGLPVIVSKATGFEKSVRHYHAGWITHTQHASELAQKFLLAYKKWTQDGLAETGRNAHDMIRDKFLWPRIVADYHRVLYHG